MEKRCWRLFAAILLFLSSKFVGGQIHVLSPKSLVETLKRDLSDATIVGSTATFGAPSYGESFEGRLWYVDDMSGNQYCKNDYITDLKALQERSDPTPSLRNIFVLRRGGCPFVSKVIIAEKDGNADCVIMVDEETSSWTRTSIVHILMSDDRNGHHVKIPSILITKNDGKMLIDSLKGNTTVPVIVKIEWALPQEHTVRVDFWTDSGKKAGVDFLREYASHAEALQGYLSFHTHYNVFSLPVGDSGELCLEELQDYCDDPPDGASGITGREVVLENIRQLCIWNRTVAPVTDAPDGPSDSRLWWLYVSLFATECRLYGPMARGPVTEENKNNRLGEACSKRVMQLVGIDTTQIDQCVISDGHKLLDIEKDNKAWNVIALRINSVRFSGNLDPNLVTRAICSAFQDPPAPCNALIDKSSTEHRVVTIKKGGSGPNAFTFFCLMIVILACALYLYQRYIKKRMQNTLRQEVMLEVKAQMQEYYQMSDSSVNLPEDFRQSRPFAR